MAGGHGAMGTNSAMTPNTCYRRMTSHLPGRCLMLVLVTGITLLETTASGQPIDDPARAFNRALTDFTSGRVTESLRGFDALAELFPDSAPQMWQRGIAL